MTLQESTDKKSSKEKKKKGLGKFRQGESSSFIPLFREPSSIEKILDEAEREHKLTFRPPGPPPDHDQPRTPTFVPPSRISASPRVPSLRVSSPRPASPRAASPRLAASPRASSPRSASTSTRATPSNNVERQRQNFYRPEPTARNQNASATKIQAVYRGYVVSSFFSDTCNLV